MEEIIDISSVTDKYDKYNGGPVKRILCYTTLVEKSCHYGKKCMYAHSLDEQKIDKDRKKAYDIIKSTKSLDSINLQKDTKLYSTLKLLTKLCPYCSKGCCPGGYNCKYGSLSKKYQVCYDDLATGKCQKSNCDLIHLSDRGMIPHAQCSTKHKHTKKSPQKPDANRMKKSINKSIFLKSDSGNLDGILLTDSFFTSATNEDVTDSETEEDIKQKIHFLNSHDDLTDSDDESIFVD